MCKAPQPCAGASDKLDLRYVKSSPATARLQCHIFTSAPLIRSFKKETDISNPCRGQTSLMNPWLFQEGRIRATCWRKPTVMLPRSLPPSSLRNRKLAGWGSSQALPWLAGNADVSLACSGVDTAPSVQPQCSPFLARFQGLQSQRKSPCTFEASTRPARSLCPANQTKPRKQLHEKCPTAGAGQHLPSNVVIRGLGLNHS